LAWRTKAPALSLPRGTLLAILFTLVVYAVQIVLMAGAVPAEALQQAPFVALQEMSVFGPLIMLGVFAATLSSALGSFLGAPRILQAMGKDRLMGVMVFFGKGAGSNDEPRRATVLTLALAIGVVWAGDLNAVAEIISMFFLIAYGMINLSAFVESRSGNPSFRPTFRFFHWGAAFAGAVGCGVAMMKINDSYAMIALAVTAIIYFYLKKREIKTSYGDAKRGFIFKRTRDNLLYLEEAKAHPKNWRPMLVTITEQPHADAQLVRMGAWLESRRGLYSVLQIAERADEDLAARVRLRRDLREELKRFLEKKEGIVAFPEALATEAARSGLADFLQSYSIGGIRPNTALVRMPSPFESDARERFLERVETIATFDLNLAVLKPGDIAPNKDHRRIDLWWRGEKNGSLMAMFAYLMTLEDTWSSAEIRIMRVVRTEDEERESRQRLNMLKERTRLPAKIRVIMTEEEPLEVIAATSGGRADLVLLGMKATSAEEARRSLDTMDPVLDRLPATLLIWSNGEADVFA
jgi:solute carrier family 12 (sodium/potassium/chloride transporter), member 2